MKVALPRRAFGYGLVAATVLALIPSTSVRGASAPLFDNIGDHHHPVTTSSPLAQKYFNQAMALMFNFNHTEAIRSFKAAQEADPKCAMAFWGEAVAYGPHVNAPMFPENVAPANAALSKAAGLAGGVSECELAYIEALATRYPAEPVDDRSSYDAAYADAMAKVAASYPDDHDAAVLHAEAIMDTMPWDYWQPSGQPKPAMQVAIATLEGVMLRQPMHSGANHLYIHAVEAGPSPHLAEAAADRLANAVPALGHLTHMPAHIYLRMGRYEDAIESNVRAVAADERYIASCLAQGFYPGVYYPHNVHFLWQAQLLTGRSAEAIGSARKVSDYANAALCGTPVVEAPRFRHLVLVTWARFGKWDEILAEPSPAADAEFVVDRAAWRYARALAQLARGNTEAAVAEGAAFQSEATSDAAAKAAENPYFPVRQVLKVAGHLIDGKIAEAKGDKEKMVAELTAAVDAQDKMPYMEPPFWFYSARQTLGAALLRAGDATGAEVAFRGDLKVFPRNSWGLLGLSESLKAQGREGDATSVEREFSAAWKHADTKLDLAWF
jgi:tetratricopeptide (TPR) repeat protein